MTDEQLREKALESRKKERMCKNEIMQVMIKHLQEDDKGQLTALYTIKFLEGLIDEIESKALMKRN